MAGSNIDAYESSQQDGQPVECYKFTYGITSYQYTSGADDMDLTFTENGLTRTETYLAEHIKRETIKPTCKGDSSSLIVTVSKDNPVAKLYQGPPPEKPVTLIIYRLHEQDLNKRDIMYYGRVSQGSFDDSECNLTVKIEKWSNKEIPRGRRSFYCNRRIYEKKCRLNEADWTISAYIYQTDGLNIYAKEFGKYPDGYFAGGLFRFEGYGRQIAEHVGERVKLKYPFYRNPRETVTVAPGCDHLFRTCAKRFQNTLNFDGCPYVSPANPEKKNVGRGVYWVDSLVVQRDTDGFVGTID